MKNLYIVFFMMYLLILTGCNHGESPDSVVNPEIYNRSFDPQVIAPGNESDYKISLKMDENETFHVSTSIQIKKLQMKNGTN
ncbi:hypothetical protein M3212_20380 [Alkalihalobacillus oceani]|uniref:hypothetical protein n=1 Tax=Halalkalibacter oceani TaxID=1653776 RepID=UPI00203F347F|nr:hypothetical protein [Halalkalibacter oceani]MCM3763087.1 hypothetical protein [Halalkalibacter oceani]